MEGRRVDRLLRRVPSDDRPQQIQELPLVLLIAAR
jgi:hypothetical protein